jgi:hypothetical protein
MNTIRKVSDWKAEGEWLWVQKKPVRVHALELKHDAQIETLEGVMKAKKGDFLIKGVEGEIYAIKATIFKKTYDILKVLE